jgi:hypothetical protein
MGGGDTRRLGLISIAIMLAAFARLLANDSFAPLLREGQWPAMIASLAGGGATLALLRYAAWSSRSAIKEYTLIISLVLGMTAGQITRLVLG